MSGDDDRRVSEWVANVVVILITIVWAGNFLAPIFRPAYKPPMEVNYAFGGAVGVTLGYRILKEK